ncbi:hypothetical protein AGDE_12373 [Angomonas deanei]|uniref:Uncharacterized protein n=1 Tax=Angomonas deanei TaxID=59799 RepID=A0A7G2CF45_9TRYP|nr:hypothetical protein AGDE_12373 [Angomonas deanei]CAD2217601.1 hypothetical protein, conserved [Angomonas deanei]|eukprot:EPY24386.1 hypothetical protein AGDE_12373 [Angomonas deanei]
MSAIVTTQRYNWMGYHGTETDEVDTALLRLDGSDKADNNNYERRQQVVGDIKERLYLIKKDLDLIPEEELRAEEEQRQRRKQEKERRAQEEKQRQAEEKQRQAEEAERRKEEQRQAQEEAQQRQAEEAAREAEEAQKRQAEEAEEAARAARWRALHDSDDDSDAEQEQNELLEGYVRSQEEIDDAVKGFAAGTRGLLLAQGAGYVSYLDGGVHLTLEQLEQHNSAYRPGTERLYLAAGGDGSFPSEEEFNTQALREALQERELARQKLESRKVLEDPTYAARLRTEEKDAEGQPLLQLSEEDAERDVSTYNAALNDAKEAETTTRQEYNQRAKEWSSKINTALYSSVAEGGEAVRVLPEEVSGANFAAATQAAVVMPPAPAEEETNNNKEEEDPYRELGDDEPQPQENNEPKEDPYRELGDDEPQNNNNAAEDPYRELGDDVEEELPVDDATPETQVASERVQQHHENNENENIHTIEDPVKPEAPQPSAPVEGESHTERVVEEEHVSLKDDDFTAGNNNNTNEEKTAEEDYDREL